VPGGTFVPGYDGVSYLRTDKGKATTVSSFRLDRFEVTVGRFRQFVHAIIDHGFRPAGGSGKHTHLRDGKGLLDSTQALEAGWDSHWNASLLTRANTNDSGPVADVLRCSREHQGASEAGGNWTPNPGPNENLPINCVDWYEAYAFCIWDGGFLPSSEEFSYAASAGSEQRVYPWSVPPISKTIDCSYANYGGQTDQPTRWCHATGANDVGSESPKGDGKWGHADLTGNVAEWILDGEGGDETGCMDCARLSFLKGVHLDLGASYADPLTATWHPNALVHAVDETATSEKFEVLASYKDSSEAAERSETRGVRCARRP
jgi:formylglycine-generating enzyme required for sulfatase activity